MLDRTIAALLLLAVLAWTRPAQAAESYANCSGFITSLPTVITTQGTWCLGQDLSTAMFTGNAIEIKTNNVTIDCNDFKVGGLAAGPNTSAIALLAVNRLNITVRNCNVRGFGTAVYLSGPGSGGHAVEDNRFDSSALSAVYIEGDGSVVRRNRITNTGGPFVGAYVHALFAKEEIDVVDNTISGVRASAPGGFTRGMYLGGVSSGTIRGNRVRDVVGNGSGVSRAITNAASGRILLTGNHVIGDGGIGSIGLSCLNGNAGARDNMISGFATGIDACGDAGGNFFQP